MAARRLTKEVKDITTDQTSRSSLTEPQPFILSPSEEDIFLWNVTFNAPELDRENKPHPYAGGVFHGKYVVPQTYPFQPPKFNLVSPIYHPAVTKWGSICCCNIEQLSVQWSPAVTLAKLSTLIYEHLFFKYDSCYCGDDALITLAGKNKKLYEAKAREWITVHFKGPWTPQLHHLYTNEYQQTVETFFKIWYLSRIGKRKSSLVDIPYEIWLKIADHLWRETFFPSKKQKRIPNTIELSTKNEFNNFEE